MNFRRPKIRPGFTDYVEVNKDMWRWLTGEADIAEVPLIHLDATLMPGQDDQPVERKLSEDKSLLIKGKIGRLGLPATLSLKPVEDVAAEARDVAAEGWLGVDNIPGPIRPQ